MLEDNLIYCLRDDPDAKDIAIIDNENIGPLRRKLDARGIPYRTIILTSVMKVTLLSFITLLSLSVGSLLGGTAIIESIFMWDGVGKMAVDAILMRDYPIILAYVVWLAIIYVIFNLITDILYHYLDPRIRLGAKK